MDEEFLKKKLFTSVKNNDISSIQEGFKLLEKLNENNEKLNLIQLYSLKKSGDTLLHVAARLGHFEILRYLICNKCGNLEVTNHDGKTPLHEAAHHSKAESLIFLIEQGGNIEALKNSDWTPLMLACTKPDLNTIKILLDNRANLFVKNKDGWHCFQIATREGNIQVLKLLFIAAEKSISFDELQCKVMNPSKNGRNLLHTAAIHGHSKVIEYLAEKFPNLDFDVGDNCSNTPLMETCRAGNVETAELLIEKFKAKVDSSNHRGLSCLHVAAESGQIPILDLLITKYKMDVNSSKKGMTPLLIACRQGQCEAVKRLIELGADITLKDSTGRDCFEIATLTHNDKVLNVLGAFVSLKL